MTGAELKKQRIAVIVGAGPAGLTAGLELLERTDVKPIIFEKDKQVGGISKTVYYKGNRIDIGGHRFFSKSDVVMGWWQKILQPEKELLIRNRISHIYFMRKFFDYPVALNARTLKNFGTVRILKIIFSYLKAVILPIKKEKNLEDFFINRFGEELYSIFFKDYTQKVWGVPCISIRPEWGAQRIKGLSISKVITHAIKKIFSHSNSIKQKEVETSLINRFLYPKFGPGQMWEEVAHLIREKGGEIYLGSEVVNLVTEKDKVTGVNVRNNNFLNTDFYHADYVISSMPVKDLIGGFLADVPADVKRVAGGLSYRDFIIVGLLLKKMATPNMVEDNWIYIQEPDVRVGRLQIFNNWSPYLVHDKNNIWLGLEYFCNEGDELWQKCDGEFTKFVISEMSKIGLVNEHDVIDSVIIRVAKTYPAYFGTYDEFDTVRRFTDSFKNLFLVGRNGMHRYNNQDHSMLAAMAAVDNILKGVKSKDNIWAVNSDEEYHEEKK